MIGIGHLPEASQNRILGGNVLSFYGIET